MNYYNQRWEGCHPMSCLNKYDKNDRLVFENDILYYQKENNYCYFIIKKGTFQFCLLLRAFHRPGGYTQQELRGSNGNG